MDLADRKAIRPGRRRHLWLMLLMGPAIFLINLQVVYLIVTLACERGEPWLHVSAVLSACVAAGAALSAWRRRYLDARELETEPSVGGNPPPYPEYMLATLASMTGALFAPVIVAQWLSIIVHSPCAQI